ncbi:hypothetical protein Fmac_008214 [Flemingia macrophylla]|uniref:Protein kinase domain-containing protein n=1 Tax=Flemingia macrophylla TaxID=520843 RepID=A0ABD1MWU6_9FABA
MAEVGTIGKVHHFNLVQLYGFCIEQDLRALVYEYMANGSLDRYLFHEKKTIGFEKLYEIAVGTARGISYLHEDCKQRIIHYDIKPGDILLDRNFNPKIADFGLAKLCNRDNTRIAMTGGRGTPGYAAPELWMPFPVTHKCDVYRFGMLLFEIMGRRRNLDINLHGSEDWFPVWVWKRYDAGEQGELIMACGIEKRYKDMAERKVMVALLCVQFRPELRPIMSDVVKMLEGSVEISKPLNPFQHIMDAIFPCHSIEASQTDASTSINSSFSAMVTKGIVYDALMMTLNWPLPTVNKKTAYFLKSFPVFRKVLKHIFILSLKITMIASRLESRFVFYYCRSVIFLIYFVGDNV